MPSRLFHSSAHCLLKPLALGALLTFASGLVQAEQSIQPLPEITVTADKTERALERIPAGVAVMDGDKLEHVHITGMKQLEGRIPGLSFQPFGQAGLNAPTLRGLTANFSTFSTSTLLLVDGVPVHTTQGFEDAMLDVDHIEVLRRP